MKLRYDGPRAEVAVLVEGERVTHRKGDVLEYPEGIAQELLEETKHTFSEAEAATAKPAVKKKKR